MALAQEDGPVTEEDEVGADDAAAAVIARLADFHHRKRRVLAPTGLVRVVVSVEDRGGAGVHGHLGDFLDTGPAKLDALA